jgi:hypothetical protein
MAIKFSDIFSSVDDSRIEEVFNKTRDVAEVVGKKSAERIELSRKKVECIDAKAKLNKLYESYGRLSYDMLNGVEVNQHELDNIADRITGQRAKIDSLQAEIEYAKEALADSLAEVAKQAKDTFNPDSED